jgi:hypothetical protein
MLPQISAKTLDSSKRIVVNSTIGGPIGFNSTFTFSSIELNKTDGMLKITDANLNSTYVWPNIGFANDNVSNNMIIASLKEDVITYTDSVNSTTQRVWTPSKASPVSTIGAAFIWNNINKITTLVNSAVIVKINWLLGDVYYGIPRIMYPFILIAILAFVLIYLKVRRG